MNVLDEGEKLHDNLNKINYTEEKKHTQKINKHTIQLSAMQEDGNNMLMLSTNSKPAITTNQRKREPEAIPLSVHKEQRKTKCSF